MALWASWTALGVHALGALVTSLFLRPCSAAPIEHSFAFVFLVLGYLTNVVRFVAEALKFGRWPQPPASYVTNWIRYVGGGLGAVFFLSMLAMLSYGGPKHFVFNMLALLFSYAVLTFAALAFGTSNAVIAFFVIALVIFACAFVMYFFNNNARRTHEIWIPLLAFVLEVGFFIMTAISLFSVNAADNGVENIVFAFLSIGSGLYALFVFMGSAGSSTLFHSLGLTSDDRPGFVLQRSY